MWKHIQRFQAADKSGFINQIYSHNVEAAQRSFDKRAALQNTVQWFQVQIHQMNIFEVQLQRIDIFPSSNSPNEYILFTE